MRARFAALLLLPLLAACGPTDRQLVGRYRIVYSDTFNDMHMCWSGDNGGCAGEGLPGPQLAAAGYDDKFVVAAVHPYDGGGRAQPNVTIYYYVIRALETANGNGLPYKGIHGPFGPEAFAAEKKRLGLPGFGWHIADEY